MFVENIKKASIAKKTVMDTYRELVKKRLNINNPLTDFVKMAVIVLGIPIVPSAFFPKRPFHFGYLANVADIPD